MTGRRFTGFVLPAVVVATVLVAAFLSRTWDRVRLARPEGVAAMLVPAGDLRVVYHTPEGSLSEVSLPRGVVATFSLPVVSAAEAEREPASPPLQVDPPLPGRFRWLGTRAIAFFPERLPVETTIHVTVNPSVHAMDGRPLAAPCSWTFRTPERAVTSCIPASNARNVPLEPRILLAFNHPIPADTARLRLAMDGRESDLEPTKAASHHPTLEVRPATAGDLKDVADKGEFPLDRTLVARPSEPLREGFDYAISFHPDAITRLLGAKGDSCTTFSTRRALQVTQASHGKHDPDEAVSFTFTNDVSYRELVRNLTVHPAAAVKPVEDDTETQREPSLGLRLKPRTRYEFRLSPDLRDAFGNRLGSEFRTTITTTDFEKDLTISSGEHVMESYLPPLFPVSVRNLQEFQARVARVPYDAIVPLLKECDSEDTYAKMARKTIPVRVPRNVRGIHALDLRPYLQQGVGHVMVQVSRLLAPRKPNQAPVEFTDQAYLQVTNLGLVGKFAAEKSLFWVTHLKDARPAANVALEIRTSGNRVLWQGRTDAQGLAVAPGSSHFKFREKENEWAQYVVAREGNDTAVLCNEWSAATHLPYRYYDSETPYSPTVTFTERGLYRPGEEVHVKAIARRHEDESWSIPSGEAVRITLRDSRQQEVASRTLSLSEFGAWDSTFRLASDAPTGTWTVSWKSTGKHVITGSADFRVETYKPVQFEVKVRAAQSTYTRGEELRAHVGGAWLFGGPMAGAPVKWSVTARPIAWSPQGWDEFEFGGAQWYDTGRADSEGDQSVATGEGTLDAQGGLEVRAALRPDLSRRQTWEATVEGVATAPNQVQVAGRQAVLVHPGDLFLGARLGTSFVPSRQPQEVRVVAVDHEGHPRPGTPVRVALVRRDWRSVRRVSHDSGTSWISEPAESVISQQDIACGAQPSAVTITPPRAGSYVVRLTSRDSKGRLMLTDTDLYAWGDDGVGWRRYQDERLEVVSDRRSYKAGDVAHLLVQSPFQHARALVTVEQEHVLHRFVTEVKGNAPRIDVPIREGFAPNMFVSVALVRGRVAVPGAKDQPRGDDVGRPSFKMGYLALRVDSRERRLKLSVRPDQPVAQPGQEVTVNLELRDAKGNPVAGEIAFAAVDKGVLNLIGHHFPNPLESLFAPRSLGVSTAENLRCIIGERQVGEKGHPGGDGGGGGAALSGNVRWDLRTTAAWEPSLRTDAQGRAQVRFRMPDNVTTFRLMALAQTADTCFGGAEGEVVVRKPLMLTASAPRFCLVGDEATCGVLVHNQSDHAAEVRVNLQVTGAHVDSAPERTVHLDAGRSTEVRFPFVPSQPGSTRFTFTAQAPGMQDGLRLDIPVGLPRAATVASRLAGASAEGLRAQVDLPAEAIPGSGLLEISAASSAMVGLKPCLRMLEAYPYECMEQKMSRIAPYLAGGRMLDDLRLGLPQADDRRMRDSVSAVLSWMGNCQRDSGGLSLYPGDAYASPFVTVYALQTMDRARRKGFTLNETVRGKAVEYVRSLLTRTPLQNEWEYPLSTREALSLQAYALDALTLHDVHDFASLGIVYGRRSELGLFGRAHLLGAIERMVARPAQVAPDTLALWQERRNELRRQMAERFRQASGETGFVPPEDDSNSWIYDSRVRSTAVALDALLQGSEEPGCDVGPAVRWLVEHAREPRWLSTQDQVALLGALNTYYQRYEKETPAFALSALVGGRQVGEALFVGRSLSSRHWDVPFAEPGQSLPLDLVKTGRGLLHYDVRLRYATRFLDPIDHGIYVERRIEPVGGGTDTGTWHVGDLLRVTVRVVVPDDRKYVVVDDPLPAGMEVVDQSFDTEARSTKGTANEDREARRRPWWTRWSAFTRQETYDDRVLLFGDLVSPGVHTTSYLVRATHRGTWLLPATHASCMYAPEIYGHTAQRTIDIQ